MSLSEEFRKLFGSSGQSAVVQTEHVLGKAEVVLSQGALEARQNMGWTDFDAVRDLLFETANRHGVELMEPGPDGISQPVLRMRLKPEGALPEVWKRLNSALLEADEILKRYG